MEQDNPVEGTSTEIKDPAAVLAALDRAKTDAKKFREEKEALEKQLEQFNTKTSVMKNKLVNEKINSILAESGIKNAERLLKYIKMDEIDLTDEFEVARLEAQIETLKTDLPELFNPKKILAGKADSGAQSEADVELSASEIQARRILGRK
mgnify:CR=1 FL=1